MGRIICSAGGQRGRVTLIKNMDFNDLKVNCYSGYTYAEEPRSFEWGGVEYEVEQVEKAWREPGERHFQVRAGGNKFFKLCYNEAESRWSVIEVVQNQNRRLLCQ